LKSNKRAAAVLAAALVSLACVIACAQAADAAPLVYSVPIRGAIEHGVSAFPPNPLRSAMRLPLVPAASSTAAIDAHWPMQIVLTSERMYCIVS